MDRFTYLGAEMTSDGGGAIDLRKRLGMAYGAFLKLKKMWQTNIGRKNKIQLFKILVLSTPLYGCETWKLTQGEERKLDTFQSQCFRRIFKLRCQQHVTNHKILEMAEAQPISNELRRRRWMWIGHVLRGKRDSDCAVALE